MPEIKIVTEVAGRVCALPVELGGSVGDGDDIAFVEAMKMEIPVASPAAGKLKLILVNIDDVVAEGQVLADHRNLDQALGTHDSATICQSQLTIAANIARRCHRHQAMT